MAEKHSLSDEGCGEFVAVNAPFANDANQLSLQLFLNASSLFQLHRKTTVTISLKLHGSK